MKCISVFEKYKDYDKKVILLAIETMSPEDRMILKKGYGIEYKGDGHLFKSEEFGFELVDKKLNSRIKGVYEFLKNGKLKNEIITFYSQKNNISYFSMYSDKTKSINSTQLNKIPETFLDFFAIGIRKIITKMLPNISEEDREIISYFYWGKNFDIPKRYEPNQEKIQQLNLVVSKIKIDALKKLKESSSSKPIIKPSSVSKKESINNPKKEMTIADKNSCESTNIKVSKTNIKNQESFGFLDYFDKKDHEKVLQIIEKFKVTNPNYYEVINKKYSGKRYEIVNNIELGKENATLYNAKNKIKNLLLKPEQLEKIFKKSHYEGFLNFFDEKDHEKVLQIIEEFKVTNPNYYEVINKKYSGKRYEIVNNIELGKENATLCNAKNKIKNVLKFSPTRFDQFLNRKVDNIKEDEIKKVSATEIDKKLSTRKKGRPSQPFLNYFETTDHERVLEIVEKFKEIKPNYYETINKKYSGKRYEIANDVKLSKKEQNNLVWARKKVINILEKEKQQISEKVIKTKRVCDKSSSKKQENINVNEIIIESINDILKFVPKYKTDNIILNTIVKNRKFIFRIMPMDDIINCYIDNLSYFEDDDAVTIIKTIAIYQPDKIAKLVESSYLKDKLQYLTLKEQEYIYLTLLSYNNKFLTPERIAEMLEMDKKTLEQYEIVTSNEDINKLNILFKKN